MVKCCNQKYTVKEEVNLRRRLAVLCLFCLLLVSVFATAGYAENAASRVELYCTVNQDGDCLVSMTVNLHMDTVEKSLAFPLPAKAKDIKLNGGAVGTTSAGDAILANVTSVTGGMIGDFPLRFDYAIPGAVQVNADRKLQLDLPMLSGFSYSTTNFSFIITLPGDIKTEPQFYSTYQQNGFDANLDLIVNGNMITGTSNSVLHDHESVSLSMIVDQELFPNVSTYQREGNPELVPMGILAGLALVYWLLFLRTSPPVRARSTAAPSGITAGEITCKLTMTGADLTMMVLSWATLGYILIQLDGSGRVLLHKRMDMGNERSLFEMKVFQSLFGSRRTVDCSSTHYARAYHKTAAMVHGEKAMVKSRFGSRRMFRFLLCGAQAFCGVCIAMNMTGMTVLQILFCVLFVIFGVFSAWQIQGMAFCTHVRHKTRNWIGLGCMAVWVGLGVIAHQPWIPLGSVVVQYLCGFLNAYGGRRTDLNKTECEEILGLRHYLRGLPGPEAGRLYKVDPEFFFRMAPYAISMGVGKPFAAAFGRRKLEQCPYFVTRIHGKRSAEEWMRLMLQAVSLMDDRARRMAIEKWMAVKIR